MLGSCEERLKQSEENFRSLAENSPTGIFVYDGRRLRYANPRLSTMMGYPPEEAETAFGQGILRYIQPSQRAQALEILDSGLAGAALKPFYKVGFIQRNGSLLNARVFLSLTRFDSIPVILGNMLSIESDELS